MKFGASSLIEKVSWPFVIPVGFQHIKEDNLNALT